ncbi:metallo-beta-lactamase family protein [Entamoeba histolytica HM-1:IMSS-B]|uniref:Metallo-beta-lactamase family protein n=6 Tax=Entamoeba histolytica TaxID=5759 RepID=C4M1A9_ENTH1|nr:metallo-beta-lactamase family protein [Entamoeba histolytica HM-1:IMSS]EMD49629.1 metallobeta-lactamase family protein [Entamoeba histolytica KU27]EMH75080.1 metallo-beta-lactamase family protein [Entamoeba histolytica HM-1:IMSS-B]EMS11742.1 metallo-beta-lactamase family protein [Entamoeba histolytica HM-3:IMSS]ENY61016.1 metallo-beta-lactamase family protein, putative [Entamoeba histolytica HM-1:IMSS-A]GAT94985.1 metallo-beta-lactamase family protein [Entamoeba histolytica]|eukprot:XP_656005.1 metallo-beta-lactamase family protein [Entamoeba histolytica HM-1:IMSS]
MSLKVRILGCGGNIGFKNQSTCLMCFCGELNEETKVALIDGGTGIIRLKEKEIPMIKDVVLTHAHIDHTCGISLLVESFYNDELIQVCKPTLHCSHIVLEQLNDSIFKKGIWMNLIEKGFMTFQSIEDGEQCVLSNGITITAVKCLHSVLTLGYIISNKTSAFAFTGDTTYYEPFWKRISEEPKLKGVICEVSLSNELEERALISNHMTPKMLQEGIKHLLPGIKVYATHIKSYSYYKVIEQLKDLDREIIVLEDEMVLEF